MWQAAPQWGDVEVGLGHRADSPPHTHTWQAPVGQWPAGHTGGPTAEPSSRYSAGEGACPWEPGRARPGPAQAHLFSSSSSSLMRLSSLALACFAASSSPLSTSCSPDSWSTLAMRSFFTTFRAFLGKGRERCSVSQVRWAWGICPLCCQTEGPWRSCRQGCPQTLSTPSTQSELPPLPAGQPQPRVLGMERGMLTWFPEVGSFPAADSPLLCPFLKEKVQEFQCCPTRQTLGVRCGLWDCSLRWRPGWTEWREAEPGLPLWPEALVVAPWPAAQPTSVHPGGVASWTTGLGSRWLLCPAHCHTSSRGFRALHLRGHPQTKVKGRPEAGPGCGCGARGWFLLLLWVHLSKAPKA